MRRDEGVKGGEKQAGKQGRKPRTDGDVLVQPSLEVPTKAVQHHANGRREAQVGVSAANECADTQNC